jgi:hypothetical protein
LKRPSARAAASEPPAFHNSGRPARSAAATEIPTKDHPDRVDEDSLPISKMYAQRKKSPPPKKKQAPSAKSSLKMREGTAPPVWEGTPDEPCKGGWPKGWIKRVFQRKNGASKGHTDRYWYSPISSFKLRSMVEVHKFMTALKAAKGDEATAKRTMKNY